LSKLSALGLKLRQSSFIERVRALAADSANIKWSFHAQERMIERGIELRVALTVIRTGQIRGDLEAGQNDGEWKANIVRALHGIREVGTVVLVISDARILVKTVEWEDLK